jgi:hypothetical protein
MLRCPRVGGSKDPGKAVLSIAYHKQSAVFGQDSYQVKGPNRYYQVLTGLFLFVPMGFNTKSPLTGSRGSFRARLLISRAFDDNPIVVYNRAVS